MTIETVYLSQKAKDQLIKIKRATGIQNWNILCRWAFCLSLADKTLPGEAAASQDEHAIEMTWKVFGGQEHELYLALLLERCKQDNLEINKETLLTQLRNHLYRGIGQVLKNLKTKKIDGLIGLLDNEITKGKHHSFPNNL